MSGVLQRWWTAPHCKCVGLKTHWGFESLYSHFETMSKRMSSCSYSLGGSADRESAVMGRGPLPSTLWVRTPPFQLTPPWSKGLRQEPSKLYDGGSNPSGGTMENCKRCNIEVNHITQRIPFDGRYGTFYVRFVGYECPVCGWIFSTTKQRRKNRKAMNRGYRDHDKLGSQLWM